MQQLCFQNSKKNARGKQKFWLQRLEKSKGYISAAKTLSCLCLSSQRRRPISEGFPGDSSDWHWCRFCVTKQTPFMALVHSDANFLCGSLVLLKNSGDWFVYLTKGRTAWECHGHLLYSHLVRVSPRQASKTKRVLAPPSSGERWPLPEQTIRRNNAVHRLSAQHTSHR